jgi:hypothetical protein
VLAALAARPDPAAAQTVRHVSAGDPTCGGLAPCDGTIQAAVDAALAADSIRIAPGTYAEQLAISGKNNTAGATEADRIVIEADPAAPVGSVVLQGTVGQCTQGHAVRFQQSKFITLRGLTITAAGGQAISRMGGNNDNRGIHLDRLRIHGNGSGSCNGPRERLERHYRPAGGRSSSRREREAASSHGPNVGWASAHRFPTTSLGP